MRTATRPAGPSAPVLLWFRDDLRLSDNPALSAALAAGGPLLAVFVLDQDSEGLRPLGGASRWWLHGSLESLRADLRTLGGDLHLFRGPAAPVIRELCAGVSARACFWNRRYGAGERRLDDALAAELAQAGVSVETTAGLLLHEPQQVRTKADGAFRVFTPFLRASLAIDVPRQPLPRPSAIDAAPLPKGGSPDVDLADLGLLPEKPDWAGGLRATWTPGEPHARSLLQDFLESGLPRYAEDRNRPSLAATSRLSPHLRFGEISPVQLFTKARHAAAAGTASPDQVEKFIAEVVWRDFAYNLLVEMPEIATRPVQGEFAEFPYREVPPAELDAWRFGHTGYPIVDAGMRQLWQTGVMHNRVRMITASFLVKHLLADWRIGERWFWDTLCDADPASNPVNWQWVAGSGADPAPFFRIFNPTLQGEKFDPQGGYIRTHVPELGSMPPRWIHRPWAAPRAVLDAAGVTLGTTYPAPIVDHDQARARALAAFAAMRAADRDGAAHSGR